MKKITLFISISSVLLFLNISIAQASSPQTNGQLIPIAWHDDPFAPLIHGRYKLESGNFKLWDINGIFLGSWPYQSYNDWCNDFNFGYYQGGWDFYIPAFQSWVRYHGIHTSGGDQWTTTIYASVQFPATQISENVSSVITGCN